MTTADIGPVPGRIDVVVDYRLKDQLKEVPGARWDSDRRIWTIPLSWTACLALRAEFPAPGLTIGPGLREWATGMRQVKDFLRARRTEMEPFGSYLAHPGFAELRPYQVAGAELIAYSGGYLLLDDQGVGKTRTAIAAVRITPEMVGGESLPCLVVAPKSVLINWAREIELFFPDADIRVVAGTPKTQTTALEPGGDFYIVSYEGLRKYSRVSPFGSVTLKDTEKVDKELQQIEWATVICDEAHRVKSPTSIQTRALWAVSRTARLRVAMTGTPIQDTPEDLWPLLRYVAPHEYPTKTPFVDRYLDAYNTEWGVREVAGLDPIGQVEFFANYNARNRRLTKEVATPWLPPKVYETRWVELPAKLRKPYREMQKRLIAQLESGDQLTAGSTMEAANRLLQMANAEGTIELEMKNCRKCEGSGIEPDTVESQCMSCGGTGKYEAQRYIMHSPSPKVDAFMADLLAGDWEGEQVVIFSASRQLLGLVEEAFAKKKLDYGLIAGGVTVAERQEAVDAFQAGRIPYMLMTTAGAEGITLTAASTMVRLVRPWSSILHHQVEDRIHRIGSEIHDVITIVDYMMSDSVEWKQMYVTLLGKETRAQEVLRDADLLALLKGDS